MMRIANINFQVICGTADGGRGMRSEVIGRLLGDAGGGHGEFVLFGTAHLGVFVFNCFRDRAAWPEGQTTPPTDPYEPN